MENDYKWEPAKTLHELVQALDELIAAHEPEVNERLSSRMLKQGTEVGLLKAKTMVIIKLRNEIRAYNKALVDAKIKGNRLLRYMEIKKECDETNIHKS